MTGESRHLLGLLLSTFTGTSKLPVSSATRQGYVRQKKKKKMQATHHHTVPWIPRSLVSLLSLLYLSGPFCVWFIYCTGFSVVLSRRNRGRYIYLFHLLEPECQGLKSQLLHLINVLQFGKLLNLSVPKLPHCKCQ